MAEMRDAYGNPIRQTDEFGNPVPQRYHDVGGDTGYGVGTAGYDSTQQQPHKEQHHGGGVTGMLQRSGSSSSSSSEDDGQGGRRKKKGLKEKIKEKLPGGHKTDEQAVGTGHVGTGHVGTGHVGTGHVGTGHVGTVQEQHPEKKGMMEKIKEKLPGHHN